MRDLACAGWFGGLVSVRGKRLDARFLVFPVIDGRPPGLGWDLPIGPGCDVLSGLLTRCRLLGQPVIEGGSSDLEGLRACVARDPVAVDECFEKLWARHLRSLFMNLNRSASEIVTGVKPGARYARHVAQPKDDRGEALTWYFRMLIRQEQERGKKLDQIGEMLGVGKGHISQIKDGKVGVGVPNLILFADRLGRKPGELLDEALDWWPKMGKKERAKALEEAAQKAAQSAVSAEDPVPESGPSDSGRPPKKRAG